MIYRITITVRNFHTHTLLKGVISHDLETLIEIFNDTKHRAVMRACV